MIFYNNEKDECILSCHCGCGDSVQISVEHKGLGDNYCFVSFLDSAWNFEQQGWFWRFKKIWMILRNKDYYYSDICMTKAEFEEFKKWINSH